MDMIAETLPARGYEQAYGVWTGQEFVHIMDTHMSITGSSLLLYKVCVHVCVHVMCVGVCVCVCVCVHSESFESR